MNDKLNVFIEKIKKAKSIAVAGHKNPDGDSLASVLALARLIELNFNKKAICVYDGNIPDFLDNVPHRKEMTYFQRVDLNKKFDLAILLDYGAENNIGGFKHILERSDFVVEVDHHKNEKTVADLCLNDEKASSVGEIIYRFINKLKWKTDSDVLDLLTVSILTDTGNFKYARSGKVLRIMATLVDMGVNIENISNSLNNKPKKTVLTEAAVTAKTEFFYRDRLALAVVDENDYKNLDGRGDIILNLLGQIKGVEYIVLLKRQQENKTGVSLRSKLKPIEHIAAALGGGGHPCAAGAVVYDKLENVREKVLELFKGEK